MVFKSVNNGSSPGVVGLSELAIVEVFVFIYIFSVIIFV